jgi:hypothetical protein
MSAEQLPCETIVDWNNGRCPLTASQQRIAYPDPRRYGTSNAKPIRLNVCDACASNFRAGKDKQFKDYYQKVEYVDL